MRPIPKRFNELDFDVGFGKREVFLSVFPKP